MIHEDFRVNLRMAWNVVRRDLPELEAHVRRILDGIDRVPDLEG